MNGTAPWGCYLVEYPFALLLFPDMLHKTRRIKTTVHLGVSCDTTFFILSVAVLRMVGTDNSLPGIRFRAVGGEAECMSAQ